MSHKIEKFLKNPLWQNLFLVIQQQTLLEMGFTMEGNLENIEDQFLDLIWFSLFIKVRFRQIWNY